MIISVRWRNLEKSMKHILNKYVVPEFATITITYMGDAGKDNDDVICEAPYPGITDDIRAGQYYTDKYKKMKI